MLRRAIAPLVVLLLAVLIVVFWPDSDSEPPVSDPSTTTTTNAPPPTATSTSVVTTTSTTQAGSHVVETVEEAEEILRELWFGWFEGIYNQDEDRIREVVANPTVVADAVAQFGQMQFDAPPSREQLSFADVAVLTTSDHCLAVWAHVDASTIVGGQNDGVHVFIWNGSRWMFVSQWATREDRWADDCDISL